jgi:folate-binding protein YgfZ
MALFDLSDRTKLRLTGNDRIRFLNGQVTNDVRKARTHFSLPACVVNAKGKTDAFVFIGAETGALLLDAEPELRESLAARLERYLIADQVEIEDVTEELALFHVIGELAPPLPDESLWRRSSRLGLAGWDLFVPAAEHDRMRGLLAAYESLGKAEDAERLRIEQGVPRWGRELTSEIIPVEANLENEAIDYAKGCYIGQEVISRMKMSGQKNKRLCGLIALDDAPLCAGMRLHVLAGRPDPGKEVGWITSAIRSERLGKEIALGYVKRGFNEIGTQLEARSATESASSPGGRVQLVDLPFR